LVTLAPPALSEHLCAETVLAHTSRPLTLLVGRRRDAAYCLDGARDIPPVPCLAMQAPNVRERQVPKLVFVGHAYIDR
jgi:hypothetical protein